MYYKKDEIMDKLMEKNPIRILHVVGGMNRGGTETWLMHILRNIDRDRFQMDFLVHTDKPCAYDEEILSFGSRIIPCLKPAKPWLYARNFQRILSEYGPYQIVHSHLHHFSGYVLYLAKKAGIPVRIAHIHTDSSSLEIKTKWKRRFYLGIMKRSIKLYATTGLACSRKAAAALFGIHWEKDRRWQLLYCGIDFKPFQTFFDPISVRAEFGIPEGAFVIGHVGRFEQPKNHQFLLEIVAEVVKHKSNTRLLLVGDGSLRSDIEEKVIQLGLKDHVIFAGFRADIPRLMLGAMDVFLLPSLYEGLGLVLIEAQAAGLPCVFSDVIPKEVDVVKPLIHRISLLQPVSKWAGIILNNCPTKYMRSAIPPQQLFQILEQSSFNIHHSLQSLENTYGEYHKYIPK